jgi:hypothetical protein
MGRTNRGCESLPTEVSEKSAYERLRDARVAELAEMLKRMENARKEL